MISDQERLSAFFSVATAMDAMVPNPAVRSALPEIVERINLGATGIILMRPLESLQNNFNFKHIWQSRPTLPPTALRIYPFFAGDAKIHSTAAQIISEFHWAGYTHPGHTIMVNMEAKETKRCMAWFLTHEFGHALANLKEGYAFTDRTSPHDRMTAQEVSMRTFDYRLMRALGGSQYRAEVDKAIYWIKKCEEKDDKQKLTDYFYDKGKALSLCLGECPDPTGETFRDEIFFLLCYLDAIDRSQPPHLAPQLKCQLMKERFNYMIGD